MRRWATSSGTTRVSPALCGRMSRVNSTSFIAGAPGKGDRPATGWAAGLCQKRSGRGQQRLAAEDEIGRDQRRGRGAAGEGDGRDGADVAARGREIDRDAVLGVLRRQSGRLLDAGAERVVIGEGRVVGRVLKLRLDAGGG